MKSTLQIINKLLEIGLIEKYAIGGSIATLFYIEPTVTYDLDILIILADDNESLTPLKKIYEWARKNNYEEVKEHIIIDGTPVQFLPAYNALVVEAVNNSVHKTYDGIDTYVLKPEYLMAIMLDTYRLPDKERLIKFLNQVEIDKALWENLLFKYHLKEKFDKFLDEDDIK